MGLYLRYAQPAELTDRGWEQDSIPVGNGYLGANIFGGISDERIQITENSMYKYNVNTPKNCYCREKGLTNFAEIYLHFPHRSVSEYERGLCLDNALAYTQYRCGDVLYKREFFASYPDKVFVAKFTSSKKNSLDFSITPQIPFVEEDSKETGHRSSRTGQVFSCADTVTLRGVLTYYNTLYEAQLKIITDGNISQIDGGLQVCGATEALLLLAVGTNYKLCKEAFTTTEPGQKTFGEDPHRRISRIIAQAAGYSYDELYQRHIADYQAFFGRVSLELGEQDPHRMTDELLQAYRAGNRSRYLETLYFQYGRYLLICSSRKGCLPPNLQGIWNCHEYAPWTGAYFHDINVQMNYWPAFNTNLIELFEPYADYFLAYYERTEQIAEDYIRRHNPDNFEKGKCGWAIGAVANPYAIGEPGSYCGPGMGGLTSKLFWEYFDFTQDEDILRNVSYRALKGMAQFLQRMSRKSGDAYLITPSGSPEQELKRGVAYITAGCAFDQQMMWENGNDLIKASQILGEENDVLATEKNRIEHYYPVRIGWSGQVKEFAEERFYGEIGEYHHRHISQLMAVCPGTRIGENTPAWKDAAKYTLTERGDESTGWALAHRLNVWARLGDGNHAYKLLVNLLSDKTYHNLWDMHPPFQIDGNFGATAGMAEMLLQSHEGYLAFLPALPDGWADGKVTGLTARGGFEVDILWKNHVPQTVHILSKAGKPVQIKLPDTAASSSTELKVTCSGKTVPYELSDGLLSFPSQQGNAYTVTGFARRIGGKTLSDLRVGEDQLLTWEGGACDVYRSVDGAPTYERIARDAVSPYHDPYPFADKEIITYKIVAGQSSLVKTICHTAEKTL